jgi:hypothetical protein
MAEIVRPGRMQTAVIATLFLKPDRSFLDSWMTTSSSRSALRSISYRLGAGPGSSGETSARRGTYETM